MERNGTEVTGATVQVTYLPAEPESALIEERAMNWLLPVALLLIGPSLVVISVCGSRKTRSRLEAMER